MHCTRMRPLYVCVTFLQGRGVWHTAKVGFIRNTIAGNMYSIMYSIIKSWKHCVWAAILFPSIIFFHFSPWHVSLPSPFQPIFLGVSPLLSFHSPSSPHFTTSLSDYADLSEPPRKKDWVFWGRQICGDCACQQWVHGHASGEGGQ